MALPEKEVCNRWHNVLQGELYLLTYFFIDDIQGERGKLGLTPEKEKIKNFIKNLTKNSIGYLIYKKVKNGTFW
jgi:hypothetical protein